VRRTERLFGIIQILRRSKRAVTGRQLAIELEVSLRTLYRDMAELIAQNVPIRGEAGTGYLIDSDFDLPPLMLTTDELEAAMLGAAWVVRQGDPSLSRGALDLIAKLTAVIPEHLRPVLLDSALHPVSFRPPVKDSFDLSKVREALRAGRKIQIAYADADGQISDRIIWPVAIAYMEGVRLITAWCELRSDFRHFRTDRVLDFSVLDEKMPESPQRLRQRWMKIRTDDATPSAQNSGQPAKQD
jgi:predicted DNA-binding transcriptional regulator YafY